MKKRLVILGSTGSIGRSALDVVSKHRDKFEIIGLTAHSNLTLFKSQILEFNPKFIAVSDPETHDKILDDSDLNEFDCPGPEEGIEKLASLAEADIILNAIVGAAGLKASLACVAAGKRLALANKESMVIGGALINEKAAETGAEIIPVDSEHSAIWQVLYAGKRKEIRKILLTGSGGPFRDLPASDFNKITREQALNHPTWNMGPKITVDSATMMNKGLEIIEAVNLFRVPPDKIEVVIHPQSIIHSMVEFVDSSIIAQLSYPDMRLPIAYALFYPDRIASASGQVDLIEIGKLTFDRPDFDKFPLLKLAYKVIETGGTLPAVYNSANETAVELFLNNLIEFKRIFDIVTNAVEKHNPKSRPGLEDILEADSWGREMADKFCGVSH